MLTEIIDKSYELFAKYMPTRPLDICTDCCMTPEKEFKLASLPVRQIPKNLLAEYNDGAKPEKTRIEEVKHFLPRYFDLLGQFEFPTHSTELSFSRLTPFDKIEWTKDELELLNQFSVEYFKHCLSIYPLPCFNDRIDTILIMLWKAGFNIGDLLTIWENENTKESTLHFRDLNFHGFDQYNHPKLSSAFGGKELADILLIWLDTETVKQTFAATIEQLIIENKYLADTDINELNLLYDIIRTKKNGS
ncbi:hypothetical protein [Dyadobacter pollutisoli]|jgi:hypothetical protein|uniref:Uncharacterized protein n=1 Tax=Dyadobacter pollutisoli TaxID=2910158 RepID=A0A9E8SSB9_9BACT|nr:hypothetical protein [Dyadobacter pollutisoli]WAC15167.1 hypothetical protein ON006_14605 [Dyadobacter pollutisoli]